MTKCSYKFRIYPNKEQEIQLKKTIGCCRYIYNYFLELRRNSWKNEEKSVGFSETCRVLTILKKNPETLWLSRVSSVALQQSVRNVEISYSRFFKGISGYPKFKKKKSRGSARFVGNGFHLDMGVFRLAKIQTPIKIIWSRELPSVPSSCNITQNASGQWFASFICEKDIKALEKIKKQIGVDLGIETFATLSDGTKIKQPDSIRKMRRKLARANRSHSRKKIGSKNREKARLKAAKISQKIANIRQDFLHKLSSSIVRENQTIAIEDLAVKNMMRKESRSLARLIGEQGWRQFRDMVKYKSDWYGRELVVIDRFSPTSQICNYCGKTNKLSLDKRKFTCECNLTYDRDTNAAKNILAAGIAVSVCGANVRPAQVGSRRRSRKTSELVSG